MDWLTPLTDDEMTDQQAKVFDRARTKLGLDDDEEAPDWLRVMVHSPEFLKDTYMNLSRHVFDEGALKPGVKLILATVAAAHAGNRDVADFFRRRALTEGFEPHQIDEALGIAATSTSFNYYFKFRSLAKTDDFDGHKAGLRASLYMRPGLGKAFAELVNLMISTANGCAGCVSGHIDEARQHDVSKDQIDEAVRTGAIVRSICTFVRSAEY